MLDRYPCLPRLIERAQNKYTTNPLERFESQTPKKESWEVIKELAPLTRRELRERFRTYLPRELEAVEFAVYTVTGGIDDTDGGLYTERFMATKADMSPTDFSDAIGKIDAALDEVLRERKQKRTTR